MKTLFIALLASAFSYMQSSTTTVYISTGPKAYAYHKTENCSRLAKCRREGHVKAITLSEAQNMNRRPCRTCY